jgi:small subunit ribosomal protein S6
MRRYELMLVLRPDVPDDRSQAVIDRITRQISAGDGQIVKVAPWGRRRLAYPIDRHRDGSYHIILFEAPAPLVAELERGLTITEELLRHLVTRVERPVRAARRDGAADEIGEDGEDAGLPPATDDTEDDDETRAERIDESETEAAPAAID